jgi:hypothetical protein
MPVVDKRQLAVLPWFVSTYHITTLARLEAIAATPMKRRPVIWYHRPPKSK